MPEITRDSCSPLHTFTAHAIGKPSLDSYKALKVLGHGDMGVVFLVVHSEAEKPFAMKVISKDVLFRRSTSQRFDTEKDILSELNHPFLPTLHNHFETEKYKVLILDFCSGRDLNVLRHRQPEKKFGEAIIKFYGAEVVLALEHLHKLGIAYRDLKPENILIQSNGHLMLADFDLSRRLPQATPNFQSKQRKSRKKVHEMFSCASPRSEDGEATISRCLSPGLVRLSIDGDSKSRHGSSRITPVDARKTGKAFSFVGTTEYIAPEVLLGSGHDFSVDWWTLGVLLYEMVYGTTPFLGPTRKDTFVNILAKEPQFPGPPTPLHDLIKRLLVKEPDHRLGSCNGAEEIKRHLFFHEVWWEMLELVARPPFVPPPISLEDMVDGTLNLEEHITAIDLARSEKTKNTSHKPKSSYNDHHQIGAKKGIQSKSTGEQHPVLQEAVPVF